MNKENFDDKVNDFRKKIISGHIYNRLPGGNEEALAFISVYRFGSPKAKLVAKMWLKKIMKGALGWNGIMARNNELYSFTPEEIEGKLLEDYPWDDNHIVTYFIQTGNGKPVYCK